MKPRLPDKPLVADVKTMDGGYLEDEMMAKARPDITCRRFAILRILKGTCMSDR